MAEPSLNERLNNPSRPVFLFGSCPPREGTTVEKAKEACLKFTQRSAVLATDGFIVYDIQDEAGRTTMERPFPFRKTIDPAQYGSYFHEATGKQCIIYKSVVESSIEEYGKWVTDAILKYKHTTFNLVGAPSSTVAYKGPSLVSACEYTKSRGDADFGCVCIPERHTNKGNEDANMFKKTSNGASWFITQGVFHAPPIVKLLTDYAHMCKENRVTPKKVVITFAPCGRAKTMTFIKWLGMSVPQDVENRILSADVPVEESMTVLCAVLTQILAETRGCGVPLGINVESLSIFKEEIDAAHVLFERLQRILLNSYGSPWAVKWYFVNDIVPTGYTVVENLIKKSVSSELLTGIAGMASMALESEKDEKEKQRERERNEKEKAGEAVSEEHVLLTAV